MHIIHTHTHLLTHSFTHSLTVSVVLGFYSFYSSLFQSILKQLTDKIHEVLLKKNMEEFSLTDLLQAPEIAELTKEMVSVCGSDCVILYVSVLVYMPGTHFYCVLIMEERDTKSRKLCPH